VTVVDANVLLYAVNSAADRHREARSYLDGALSGHATVGFSWIALLAFLRLSTKVGLFPRPLPVDAALERVRAWLAQPTSVVLEPTPRHLDVLAGLVTATGTGGNLTSDAHLAALAIEHRATVITYDRDFGRFPGVSWREPAAAE
jgi:toxin-antitoxin system PIN domain toxin